MHTTWGGGRKFLTLASNDSLLDALAREMLLLLGVVRADAIAWQSCNWESNTEAVLACVLCKTLIKGEVKSEC